MAGKAVHLHRQFRRGMAVNDSTPLSRVVPPEKVPVNLAKRDIVQLTALAKTRLRRMQ
jgi:hypothetical protein